MNEPEVVTETVVAPPVEAHANGSSAPAELPPVPEEVSTTPPLPEMEAPAPPVAVPVPSAQIVATPSDPLEERLRRLEATLTALAEAKQAAPVAQVAPEQAGRSATSKVRDSASRVMDAGRWLLPMALGGMRPTAEEPGTADAKEPWFLVDALNELITYKYMFGDPRYRLTWTGRVMPLVFLALILFSSWIPGLGLLPSVVATVLTKLLDLLFAFLIFKVLNREARRYRSLIPQYPPISPSER